MKRGMKPIFEMEKKVKNNNFYIANLFTAGDNGYYLVEGALW